MKKGMNKSNKKIVIVGAGIAGLSAGIYGRLAGYEVEVYEKNPVAGGQCMGWNRKGCHIDNCIHWLTGTKKGTELRKVWEEIGALEKNAEFAATECFYTSYVGGKSVTLWKDLERTQKELLEAAPEDEAEIRKFIEHVKYAACCEMPAKKPMDKMGFKDYIEMGKSMADMPKVTKEYGSISLEDMAGRFKSPLLKALFTDYLPKEYTASSFIVSYASIATGNGEIPAGGSLAMTNRIIAKLKELGGHLYCNQPVKRILIEKKKAIGIELENGQKVMADYVISAVDTMELFERLVGKQYMDAKWRASYNDSQTYPLFTAVQAAFVIDREVYHEKETVFFECRPFEVGKSQIQRMSVKSFEYEESFAPEGKTVLQSNLIQFDEDYLYWKSLSPQEYKEKKAQVLKEVVDRILEQFPQLQGHMEVLDCWTPMTYERYCNAYHGAYMGFITKKGVKSFRVKGLVKGVKNLYIGSQWIMAPGGLPVAVTAGKFAVWRISEQERDC